MSDRDEQDREARVVSTFHIDLYDASQDDELLGDRLAELVYGGGYEALVHQHTNACEESDHCCGPGSNFLRAHDAEVAAAAWDEVERLEALHARALGIEADAIEQRNEARVALDTIAAICEARQILAPGDRDIDTIKDIVDRARADGSNPR